MHEFSELAEGLAIALHAQFSNKTVISRQTRLSACIEEGESMNYDIIGDIHGHAEALKHLLQTSAIRKRAAPGATRTGRPFRRGFHRPRTQQLATVDLVRRMVDAGISAGGHGKP